MENIKDTKLEQLITTESTDFTYTSFSRFPNNFTKETFNYEINEASLFPKGINAAPKTNSNIYQNIPHHTLNNNLSIANYTNKYIYVSIYGGNIFKINPVKYNYITNNLDQYVYIESNSVLLDDNKNNTFNQYSNDISVSKPLNITSKIYLNRIKNGIELVPELNIIISCELKYIKDYLKSINIIDKYRTEKSNIITGDNDNTNIIKKKNTYSQILDNVSLGFNIIINDPNKILDNDIYYTHILNNVIPIFCNRHETIGPGVYIIMSNKEHQVNISYINLDDFNNKMKTEYKIFTYDNYTFPIGSSSLSIKKYIKDYNVDKSNIMTKNEIGYRDEIETLNKNINNLEEKYKTNIEKMQEDLDKRNKEIDKQKDKITLLNEHINTLNKLKISNNHVKKSEAMKDKSEVDYKKVQYTYPSEVKASNFKSYALVATSIFGLVSTVLLFINKNN